MSSALPNLLIIGAPKCGTTALHHFLGAHPEVFMSEPKELKFWQDSRCLDRLGEYKDRFPADARVRGESSTTYTYYPLVQGTPERIARCIPDVRLIYLVRNPVDRAIAHYLQHYSWGWESRSFAEVVSDLRNPNNPYIACSKYATQLELYLRVFSREQLLILEQRELRDRPNEVLQDVFRFIDVDPSFSSARFDDRLNVTEEKRRFRPRYVGLRHWWATSRVRAWLPARAREALLTPVRPLVSERMAHSQVFDERREELVAYLRPEVDRFRSLTGRTFADWHDFSL